ncbi:MAG TPA: DUF4112 domain-containing protein [Gemmatimonadaceae bacterium]
MRDNAEFPRTPALSRARGLARLLDSAVRIPGTNIRFGIDAVLGLIPGMGDAAGAGLAGYMILVAARLGAPPSVIVRMLGNVLIDMLVGAVPILGDLFDVGFKANLRNVTLVERYLERPSTTRRTSRGIVLAALVVIFMVAVGAVWLAVAVLRWLFAALGG